MANGTNKKSLGMKNEHCTISLMNYFLANFRVKSRQGDYSFSKSIVKPIVQENLCLKNLCYQSLDILHNQLSVPDKASLAGSNQGLSHLFPIATNQNVALW